MCCEVGAWPTREGGENKMSEFQKELTSVINRFSKENDSDTPDFILAEYLRDCLHAYNAAVTAREKWYGRKCGGGAGILAPSVSPGEARKESES